MKPNILYVEDDDSLAFVTKDNLELKGYQVDHQSNGRIALKVFSKKKFDLCILDIMLPEIDGISIARCIRNQNQEIPIIFITAKSMKEDRILGLKTGADDYLTKPFSIEELILKIEVFLRRSRYYLNSKKNKNYYRIGIFEFNAVNLLLKSSRFEQRMTQKEASLLQYFIVNKNNVVKRSDILKDLWGEDDYFLGRSLDVFVSRLRNYLRQDNTLKIQTIHGVGFQFILKPETAKSTSNLEE